MENRKKVAFYTLGCKLNFSETSTIARSFQDEGFDRVDFEDVADIYVINTRKKPTLGEKLGLQAAQMAQSVVPAVLEAAQTSLIKLAQRRIELRDPQF